MPTSTALSPDVAELVLALKRRGCGDVVDTSKLTRSMLSSDASLYRVVPAAVARPRNIEQTLAVLDAARAVGIPITPRGAGTSCAGNAVGRAWSLTPPDISPRSPRWTQRRARPP